MLISSWGPISRHTAFVLYTGVLFPSLGRPFLHFCEMGYSKLLSRNARVVLMQWPTGWRRCLKCPRVLGCVSAVWWCFCHGSDVPWGANGVSAGGRRFLGDQSQMYIEQGVCEQTQGPDKELNPAVVNWEHKYHTWQELTVYKMPVSQALTFK